MDRAERLLVFAPLGVGAGCVDHECCFAFWNGDPADVDAFGEVDGGSGVAEVDCRGDAVKLNVGGAECGPLGVAVVPDGIGYAGGLGQESLGEPDSGSGPGKNAVHAGAGGFPALIRSAFSRMTGVVVRRGSCRPLSTHGWPRSRSGR